MPEVHHVYLIPGFFGFANLGELVYFAHVREFLAKLWRERGVEARVWVVKTHPTASIRRRAERLLEAMAETAGQDDSPIHLVGHSSGGLDARLFATPDVSLHSELRAEDYARRLRSVVTLCSPHHGTPVANFFTSVLGQHLLRLLSLSTIYALRFGTLPMSAVSKLVGIFARLDDQVGLSATPADQLYDQLLGDFNTDRREALAHLFDEVSWDRALIPQLTVEGVDLFNAGTRDRPGVRYGSVVTWAPSPGVGTAFKAGFDPYAQATHALYVALWQLASRMPVEHTPTLSGAQVEALWRAFGEIPGAKANDGVVPTLSQVWGDVIVGARADHLDVVGHFSDRKHAPPHIDWLSTGAGFSRTDFESLWTAVASYLLAD